MEHPSKRQRISRIQRRSFQKDNDDFSNPSSTLAPSAPSRPVVELREEPLLAREKRGDPRMLDDRHRMLHHRQVTTTATEELVFVVSVLAEVDVSGNTLAVQTLPAVPSVPPFPSDLTVPAVPQVSNVVLPSVPAYPFGTTTTLSSEQPITTDSQAAPSVQPTQAAPTNTTNLDSATTAQPTVVSAAGADSSSLTNSVAAPTSSVNSSITLESTLSSGLSSIIATSPTATATVNSSSLSSSIISGDISGSSGSSAIETASDGVGGGGANGTPTTYSIAAGSTNTAGSGSSGGSSGPNTATVVGGVFGGLAGMALILALILLLLRWYKKKQRGSMHRLEDDTMAPAPTRPPVTRSLTAPPATGLAPPMTERRSFLPPAAAGFLHRFSGSSKGSDYGSGSGSPTQERGFQKISGRKLPSAFSEGITEADIKGHKATLSDTSWYRDSQGKGSDYAGPSGTAFDKETYMPSPARTPVVHNPFILSTTPPRPDTQESSINNTIPIPGTLGRSLPSQDGSRGSKFTEDV